MLGAGMMCAVGDLRAVWCAADGATRVEARHERVAGEDAGDGVKRAHGVLAGRGDVTADAAEGFGPRFAAEQPRGAAPSSCECPVRPGVVEGDAKSYMKARTSWRC